MNVTCVVLAAGASRRFPGNKLLYRTRTGTLLERSIRAASAYPTVVVCSSTIREHLDENVVTAVVNDQPDLGMIHSLQLADAQIDRTHAIAVLPADLALIEPQHVRFIVERAEGFDVTYPQSGDGTPGHPVVFSPLARGGISLLPERTAVSVLRDRENFKRNVIHIAEPWPYLDVDYEADARGL